VDWDKEKRMKRVLLTIAVGVACMAGDCDSDSPVVTESKPAEKVSSRFDITRCGEFSAGFESHTREILILKDKDTGRQYLVVTGCGVEEWNQGKSGSTEE